MNRKFIGLTMVNAGTAANPSKWRADYDDQSTGGTRYASMRTACTPSHTSLKALAPMLKPLIQTRTRNDLGCFYFISGIENLQSFLSMNSKFL